MAPPSISVRSLIVAELCIDELMLRVGERSGRLGPPALEEEGAEAVLTFKGDESVLTMTGRSLLSVFGETASDEALDSGGWSELVRESAGEGLGLCHRQSAAPGPYDVIEGLTGDAGYCEEAAEGSCLD